MKNLLVLASIAVLIYSCGNNSESEKEEFKDPGNLQGRIEQVCDCFKGKEEMDKQICYDLNNKYYKAMSGEEQDEFMMAVSNCENN